LWIVFAVSIGLRLAAAFYFGDHVRELPGIADQRSYDELARRVSDGYGFSFAVGWWPATPAGQPTAHWSFLYVSLLAGLYRLLGAHPLIVRLVQAIAVGFFQPYLTWKIARRIFDDRVAIAGAAASAVYAYFVYYSAALMTEALYIVAMLCMLDLACSLGEPNAVRQKSVTTWLWLGVALGAMVLLRQMFVLCVPFILGWIVLESLRPRRSHHLPGSLLRGAALAMAVLAVCVLPWTFRNYRAFGEFVPLNTNSGFAFFWGNHPVHGYRFKPLLEPEQYGALIPDELRVLNEAALDRALLSRGVGFVQAEPFRYLSLCASRLIEYVKFWPAPESSPSSNVARLLSFGFAAPLMVIGVVTAFRPRSEVDAACRSCARLLALVAIVHSAPYVLTWTLVRYRLPVDALLMPFVGSAVVTIADRLKMLRGVGRIPQNAEI
jgi:hypothetical protein